VTLQEQYALAPLLQFRQPILGFELSSNDVDLDGLADPCFPQRLPLEELGDFEVGLIMAGELVRTLWMGSDVNTPRSTTSDFER
jgi:hypothetical protein